VAAQGGLVRPLSRNQSCHVGSCRREGGNAVQSAFGERGKQGVLLGRFSWELHHDPRNHAHRRFGCLSDRDEVTAELTPRRPTHLLAVHQPAEGPGMIRPRHGILRVKRFNINGPDELTTFSPHARPVKDRRRSHNRKMSAFRSRHTYVPRHNSRFRSVGLQPHSHRPSWLAKRPRPLFGTSNSQPRDLRVDARLRRTDGITRSDAIDRGSLGRPKRIEATQ